jgi:hypothetical protein
MKNIRMYFKSILWGGMGGLLFLIFFFSIVLPVFLDNFLFKKLYNFVTFVSKPVFFILGDSLSYVSFVLGPPLLIIYWVILGMITACVIKRISISIKSRHS